MSDRAAFDNFVADMSAHQAEHAGEVTGSANQALAAPVFEKLDQQAAEAPYEWPAGRTHPDEVKPRGFLTERQSDIEARKRGWRLVREDDLAPESSAPPVVKTFTPRELELYEAISQRVSLLLSKPESGPMGAPSWRARYLAIVAEKMAQPGNKEAARVAALKTLELCSESEAAFGPIHAVRPKLVMVG